MNNIKYFIKTTFIGGALVVLPLVILISVFSWLYEFISDKVKPLTFLLSETVQRQEILASAIALIIILFTFFIVGLIVKTRFGQFSFEYLENKFLFRIPLYKIIKDTTLQLLGSNKNLFKGVALVNIFGSETRMTAFITEEHDNGSYTVFVPSGPAPTAGFIYHVAKENVEKINYPTDKAMKTIFSLGSGSKELFQNAEK
ncbi:MAG: DUF502 domain-containing protein [Ignavibacteriae bacterium]|nr:DUF502 domain-containing protein [Ignavibacteriota bacterium]NOG98534.1 DUF502 domain-containing protein [Ignavibacteriota bacterium]